MQDPIPTRPAELASTSLRDLLTGHESHLTPLVNARLGAGEPEPVGRLRGDALDALVCGQTPADRLMPMRWVTVAEALAQGASPITWPPRSAWRSPRWPPGCAHGPDGQHQNAGMSDAARDEVHALLDDREAGR